MRASDGVGDVSQRVVDLTMVVPNLLPKQEALGLGQVPTPAVPQLERFLARAERDTFWPLHVDAALLQLFAIASLDTDGPIAPITYLADGGQPGDAWCLRADPVYLHADRDRVLLFDASVLQLSVAEAHTLAQAFNEHFADRGWRVEPRHPRRWYLKLTADPGIRTHALPLVAGRDIRRMLPSGTDEAAQGKFWRALANEVQMLFHGNPVNEARAAQGALPINGLWFWGSGRLPRPTPVTWSAIHGGSPVATGLARLHEIPQYPLAASAPALLAGVAGPAQVLVVIDDLDVSSAEDPDAWRVGMELFERDWMAPLLPALRSGVLANIAVYPCNGICYRVNRRSLRRFWRRPVPIVGYLQ